MTENDRRRIRVSPFHCVESRLAQVTLSSSDNVEPADDGSAPLWGQVSFGLVRRRSPKGRVYLLGLRGAFLETACEGSSVLFAPDVCKTLQEGRFKQSSARKQQTDRNADAQGSVSGKLWNLIPTGGASASASGKAGASSHTETKSDVMQTIALVSLWGSRVKFGHGEEGDIRNAAYGGALTGALLDGEWGRLAPHPGATCFRVTFQLTIGESDLVLRPEDAPDSADAFDALKSRVAGWIAGEGLAGLRDRAPRDGHDEASGEIVLAIGAIEVDLTDFVRGAAPPALPPPAAGLLPPPATGETRQPVRRPRGGKRGRS